MTTPAEPKESHGMSTGCAHHADDATGQVGSTPARGIGTKPEERDGEELPQSDGIWFRDGDVWMVDASFRARQLFLNNNLQIGYLTSVANLPRGNWHKASPLSSQELQDYDGDELIARLSKTCGEITCDQCNLDREQAVVALTVARQQRQELERLKEFEKWMHSGETSIVKCKRRIAELESALTASRAECKRLRTERAVITKTMDEAGIQSEAHQREFESLDLSICQRVFCVLSALTAARQECEQAKRERDDAKQNAADHFKAARAWAALCNGVEAVRELEDFDKLTDAQEKLNAYIQAWSRMKERATAAEAECERLRTKLAKAMQFVPRPEEMSGYGDDSAPDEIKELIAIATALASEPTK